MPRAWSPAMPFFGEWLGWAALPSVALRGSIILACAIVTYSGNDRTADEAWPRAQRAQLARPRSGGPLASGGTLFGNAQATARVQDGLLFGRGYERIERLESGALRVLRTRTYTQVKDRESRRLVALPDPWHVRQVLDLSPELRLRNEVVTLSFHRSVDRALGRNASSRELADLFAWDRMKVLAEASGSRLVMTTTRGGRVVQRERYAYPSESIPIEIAGMAASVEVSRGAERFEFDLLLPGGDTHGVAAQVYRTHQAGGFARDYGVPAYMLRRSSTELAVVDMWLASPFKRLFFPHHFYFVFANARPAELLAVWGGDPDEHLQAFRDPWPLAMDSRDAE